MISALKNPGASVRARAGVSPPAGPSGRADSEKRRARHAPTHPPTRPPHPPVHPGPRLNNAACPSKGSCPCAPPAEVAPRHWPGHSRAAATRRQRRAQPRPLRNNLDFSGCHHGEKPRKVPCEVCDPPPAAVLPGARTFCDPSRDLVSFTCVFNRRLIATYAVRNGVFS